MRVLWAEVREKVSFSQCHQDIVSEARDFAVSGEEQGLLPWPQGWLSPTAPTVALLRQRECQYGEKGRSHLNVKMALTLTGLGNPGCRDHMYRTAGLETSRWDSRELMVPSAEDSQEG